MFTPPNKPLVNCNTTSTPQLSSHLPARPLLLVSQPSGHNWLPNCGLVDIYSLPLDMGCLLDQPMPVKSVINDKAMSVQRMVPDAMAHARALCGLAVTLLALDKTEEK